MSDLVIKKFLNPAGSESVQCLYTLYINIAVSSLYISYALRISNLTNNGPEWLL